MPLQPRGLLNRGTALATAASKADSSPGFTSICAISHNIRPAPQLPSNLFVLAREPRLRPEGGERIGQAQSFSRPRFLRRSAKLLACRVELHHQLTMCQECIETLLGGKAPGGRKVCQFGFVGEL